MKKTVYLDIDMDYFVEPIEIESIDNMRLFYDKACTLSEVEPVFQGLSAAGLSWDAKHIHCFTNHKKSYTYWWMLKKMNCTVIHIDAHSDLYRNSEKDLRRLSNGTLGCYNYLWYAVRDGYVDEIYWVIPDALKAFLDVNYEGHIIHPALVKEKSVDEGGLHIQFDCIDITGITKSIMLHVCLIGMLPLFNTVCEKVTIASSPEFIPHKADQLIFTLFDKFGVADAVSKNIYTQHQDMSRK